jgi:hypothetical protein
MKGNCDIGVEESYKKNIFLCELHPFPKNRFLWNNGAAKIIVGTDFKELDLLL